MTYLRIEEITYGEPIDRDIVDKLLELDIVAYRYPERGVVEVAEADCEQLRTMLRLATQLDINPAGIETIMHMRERIRRLQREVRALRALRP